MECTCVCVCLCGNCFVKLHVAVVQSPVAALVYLCVFLYDANELLFTTALKSYTVVVDELTHNH